MTINCFKTVSAKGTIYLPVALRRFVGIHEDDGVPGRSPAAKPFLRSKNTEQVPERSPKAEPFPK